MGILEKITQMRSQGIPDEKIIDELKDNGITPKEIEDSFSQLKIKNAIAGEGGEQWMQEEQAPQLPQQREETPQAKGYEETYAPQQYPPQQEYYQQEQYGYQQPAGTDTETIIEITEQVFSEKITGVQNQIDSLNEFKTIAQSKLENAVERIKRIETMIDQLQIAILEKVSSYSRNLDNTKKEVAMMQNTFEKLVNPIIDEAEKKISETQKEKKISKKK